MQQMNDAILLRQKLSVANGFIAKFHFKNINRHNDCLIHTRYSLLINTEFIQAYNNVSFCYSSGNFKYYGNLTLKKSCIFQEKS
ncbi:hypothetical protein D3Z06_07700 [Salmonella enterica subsp. enterica serovar Gallinarum]|nr:hypothetical protein SPUL_2351 [Salmonella enterica subsp. enterica serovar Gallinarum/Pullorum str. RKS5078]AGU65162.1 hypothetical protein SPUCDC_2337 [Salmonella enterica subsp. enterica serovar Gallinarum/Pullorum str. CDC1983-67]ALG55898.1 hypothetical protein FORC7_0996 [Salmonella enterica subsp. enterica serovar Enteritidis]AOC87528.1 hypothetical protein FORC19_3139 [Salmonella enterica]AUC50299.1 Phosphonoacetaldehyde hydrolase [Salmonella enterica subsp. enterica serovar Typhimuri